jgi:hypothetical protein
MNYEKEYIDFLIKESVKFPLVKPILEKYLLNTIEFEELVEYISDNKTGVIHWRSFKKDKDIDGLFN